MLRRLRLSSLGLILLEPCIVSAIPNQKIISGSKITYKTNSEICETIPNVTQYSGYATIGDVMHMWFWFFASRRDPTTAPLSVYLEGGPGAAAEYRLFTQNGPCKFEHENDTEPFFDSYSFNNFSNVLYLDNPIGAGFSYGNGTQVNNTKEAIPYVWNALQVFLEEFADYQSREFGIFTESFGGHYGPEFAAYILRQNNAIASGTIKGTKINLKVLGLANAWIDARIQERANIKFAYKNEFRPLINESTHDGILKFFEEKAKLVFYNCATLGTKEACFDAFKLYNSNIEAKIVELAISLYDDFLLADIRENGTRPPLAQAAYLQIKMYKLR